MAGDSTEGLRARKMSRTREEIQRRAVELFTSQGYTATTIEQIAAAADVSPRTVYRYFPTKDALVVTDSDDDRMVEAFVRQPSGLTALDAFRAAYAETFGGAMPDDDLQVALYRRDLISAEPELQGALLRQLLALAQRFLDAEARRTGRVDGRHELGAVIGAVIGIALVGTVVSDPPLLDIADNLAWVDEALAALERAFRA